MSPIPPSSVGVALACAVPPVVLDDVESLAALAPGLDEVLPPVLLPPKALQMYPPISISLVKACVLDPATILPPSDARLYLTPETVMAEAPGTSVCEPTRYSEDSIGVIFAVPTVKTSVDCCCKVEEEVPMTSMVSEPLVFNSSTDAADPLPKVMEEPGFNV